MRGRHSGLPGIARLVCTSTSDRYWGAPGVVPGQQPNPWALLPLTAWLSVSSSSGLYVHLLCFEQESHFSAQVMSQCGQEHEWVPTSACGHTDTQEMTAAGLGARSKAIRITKHPLIKSDSSAYCRSCLFIC